MNNFNKSVIEAKTTYSNLPDLSAGRSKKESPDRLRVPKSFLDTDRDKPIKYNYKSKNFLITNRERSADVLAVSTLLNLSNNRG